MINEDIYTEDRDEFTKRYLEKHPKHKITGALSCYYRLKKYFKQYKEVEVGEKPDSLKLLKAKDLKHYNMNTETNFLKHGFYKAEIEWLQANNYIKQDNVKVKENKLKYKIIKLAKEPVFNCNYIKVKNIKDFITVIESFENVTFIYQYNNNYFYYYNNTVIVVEV